MAELEKNPQLLRQGAAAVACAAVATAALPAISYRAGEQRSDALWAARAAAFQRVLIAEAEVDANARVGRDLTRAPIAELTLASYAAPEGYGARGAGALPSAALDYGFALPVAAGVRDQMRLAALDPFQPQRLNTARSMARQRRCLSEAIYYEARGESLVGQAAVAEVVLNRVRSDHYPDTICEVVYQGSYRATGCQFTFTCDGSKRKAPRGETWRRAQLVAAQAMLGIQRPLTHRATHYHTTEVDPYWSASLVETTRIGAHIFYRFPNRREREVLLARAQAPQIETAGEERVSGFIGASTGASAPPPIAALPATT